MSQNHNDLESVVEKLIHEHFDLDESLEKVIWINPETAPEIRLIQITADTLPTGDVLSFFFPPSKEIPYPMLIAHCASHGKRFCRTKSPCPRRGVWRITKNTLARW